MEKLLIFNLCEIYRGVMYSSCKKSIRRNTTWSAINISLQRNIPNFDTVLLHSNWSSVRRKYLSKIPTNVNALSCGPKTCKCREFRTPYPPRDIRKNPRSMYARVPQAMAQFVLKIKLLSLIIWQAPRAGKMNQILRCDWLRERARWGYLARSGLPAVSRKKNFPESHIINPLLTNLVRSR